jgi:hypothetical protein
MSNNYVDFFQATYNGDDFIVVDAFVVDCTFKYCFHSSHLKEV